MRRLGEILYRYPRPVILGLGVITFLAVYPASQIRTDFNLEGFYPQDDRVIENYQLLEDEFGRDDNTILVGLETPDLFRNDILSDLMSITEKVSGIPHVHSVRSLWNIQEISTVNDRLEFTPYLEPDDLHRIDQKNIRQRLLADPLVNGFLLDSSGTITAFTVEIQGDENSYAVRNRIISSLNEILSHYDYDFRISGIPYFRNQYVDLLNREIIIYIMISSLLIITLLWMLYRSALGVLLPMLIVWTTLLLTIALIQITGGYLEIMSSTIAPILLCVGVADAVHMISRYDDARDHGLSKKGSVIEMLVTLGSATFLTSITTAIGFGTLTSSSVMPMQRFGLYTAAGVLIAYMVTILFLPASLKISSGKKVFREKGSRLYPVTGRILEKISSINSRYYKAVAVTTGLVTLILGTGIYNLKVDGRVFDDIGSDSKLMQDSRFFSENLAPPFPMEFIFDTGEDEGIFNPSFIASLAEFDTFLMRFDEVERTISVHTLMNRIHTVLAPGSESDYPESSSLAAQYFLLLEVNDPEDLDQFTDFNYRVARFTALIQDAGSSRVNEIRKETEEYIANHFSDQVETTVTGTTILSADLTEKIVYSIVWSIFLAVTAIAIIMAFLFRSPKLILISLIPNIVPLVIVAGILGWFNLDIKPSTAVIFTVALGIAVDDSIHYLSRFRIEYLRTGDMANSLQRTTVKTGRAIIVTSVIIVAGFGSLLTSAFTSTALMGLLVCITILAALMADLLLLPSLFYWLKPDLNSMRGTSSEPEPPFDESHQETELHQS